MMILPASKGRRDCNRAGVQGKHSISERDSQVHGLLAEFGEREKAIAYLQLQGMAWQ